MHNNDMNDYFYQTFKSKLECRIIAKLDENYDDLQQEIFLNIKELKQLKNELKIMFYDENNKENEFKGKLFLNKEQKKGL